MGNASRKDNYFPTSKVRNFSKVIGDQTYHVYGFDDRADGYYISVNSACPLRADNADDQSVRGKFNDALAAIMYPALPRKPIHTSFSSDIAANDTPDRSALWDALNGEFENMSELNNGFSLAPFTPFRAAYTAAENRYLGVHKGQEDRWAEFLAREDAVGLRADRVQATDLPDPSSIKLPPRLEPYRDRVYIFFAHFELIVERLSQPQKLLCTGKTQDNRFDGAYKSTCGVLISSRRRRRGWVRKPDQRYLITAQHGINEAYRLPNGLLNVHCFNDPPPSQWRYCINRLAADVARQGNAVLSTARPSASQTMDAALIPCPQRIDTVAVENDDVLTLSDKELDHYLHLNQQATPRVNYICSDKVVSGQLLQRVKEEYSPFYGQYVIEMLETPNPLVNGDSGSPVVLESNPRILIGTLMGRGRPPKEQMKDESDEEMKDDATLHVCTPINRIHRGYEELCEANPRHYGFYRHMSQSPPQVHLCTPIINDLSCRCIYRDDDRSLHEQTYWLPCGELEVNSRHQADAV